MVIQKFNKLIRNRWAWGAVAVVFCLMFVGDDIVRVFTRTSSEEGASEDSIKSGVAISNPIMFNYCMDDARGYGANRDYDSSSTETMEKALKEYASLSTAAANGIVVGDEELAGSIRAMFGSRGQFDFDRYSQLVRTQLGLQPREFEGYMRREMAVKDGILRSVLLSTAWVDPMSLDQAVADATDEFSIRVARFSQDSAEANAITVDDEGLKTWYDANVKKLELPERVKVRYVRYDATDSAVLAKMNINTNDMWDLYDQYKDDRYTSTDTNGVEIVKSFDEVKDELEKELRQIAAVEFYETNLMRRAYQTATESGANISRLDTIAAEDGKTVQESDWFSLDGKVVEGFSTHYANVCPGSRAFAEQVAELDSEVEDFRYGVVMSDTAVWLLEKSAVSPAHTPDFAEAKDKIGARALRDAKADVFKSQVEAIASQGVEAVLATKNVSTNIVFSITDIQPGAFADQSAIIRAAVKLSKGEVSDFISTGTGKGLLVVCDDRKAGDAAKAVLMRSQIREQVGNAEFDRLGGVWEDWNLRRAGYEKPADDEAGVAE